MAQEFVTLGKALQTLGLKDKSQMTRIGLLPAATIYGDGGKWTAYDAAEVARAVLVPSRTIAKRR